MKATLRLSAVFFILLLSTALYAQDFKKTKTMQTTIPITCWWFGGQSCKHISGITGLKTGDYAYEVYGAQSCSFQDPLPAGSRPLRIDADFYVLRSNPYGSTVITVGNVAIAGEPIGASGSVALGWQVCDYDNPTAQFVHLPTFLGTTHENGIPGYEPGGQNSFSFEVTNAVASIEPVVLTINYEVGPLLNYVRGTGQSGPVGSVLEFPLTVRVTASDPELQLAGQPVKFEIVDAPKGSKGTALDAAGGTFESSTFTTTADGSGIASAFLKLGAKDGTYTIRATALHGVAGEPVEFQVQARTPSEIRIWREWSWLAPPIGGDSFTLSLSQTGLFKAIAYDSNGAGMGPIDVTWSVEVPKGKDGKDPGGAKVSVNGSTPASSAGPGSKVEVSPDQPGNIVLKAEAAGLPAASADLRIAGLFFDADKLWEYDKDDDLAWFVPGSVIKRAGRADLNPTVPPAPTAPNEKTAHIQTVDVHYLHNVVSSGTLKLEIKNASTHEGVAMNWPPQKVIGTDDDWLAGDESDVWLVDPATGNRTSMVEVQFDSAEDLEPATGDTMIRLYIGDFAASAQLTATITANGKTYAPIELRIPIDDNGDGLPDAGWDALSDPQNFQFKHIQSPFTLWSDTDNVPATAHVGDGLSVFDEFRGFIVAGQHRRLDPFRKDLFIELDTDLWGLESLLDGFPLALHYILAGESNVAANGYSPIVNFNLGLGSQHQRGLLVRERVPGPLYQTATGDLVPAYTRLGGYAFKDGENLDQITPPGLPNNDPNSTLLIEVYPEKHQNDALYFGNTTPPQPVDDDVLNEELKLITPGPNDILQTPAQEVGQFRAELLHLCSDPDTHFVLNIESTEGAILREVIVAHEVAHGVDIDHALICGDLMYERFDSIVTPYVFPSALTSADLEQLQLH